MYFFKRDMETGDVVGDVPGNDPNGPGSDTHSKESVAISEEPRMVSPLTDELSHLRRIITVLEQEREEGKIAGALARWEEEQSIAVNTIVQFSSTFAVVAVFLAGLAAQLLAYAGSTFAGRAPRTTDSVVYSCFLVSMVLCIASVVFLGHSSTTAAILRERALPPHALSRETRSERKARTYQTYHPARSAVRLGLNFLYASFVPLAGGLVLLEWMDFPIAPAISVTVPIGLAVMLLVYAWTFGREKMAVMRRSEY